MIDSPAIRTSILDALRALQGVTVFDGAVPATVPQDPNGYVRPYVTVYAGAPTGLWSETTVCGTADTDSVTRQIQTTLVAASPDHLDPLETMVVGALTNLRVGSQRLKPVHEQHASTVPLPDHGTSPVRYFLPLQWAITTQ